MMVQRMIVLTGSPLDYNDNTRLKSGEGEKQRGRGKGQREPYQQLICKSVALHKTVFVIGLGLILPSAEEKALAISCVPVHSHDYGLTCPLRRQHPVSKEDVKSVGGKTALTGFNPSPYRHQTDKTPKPTCNQHNILIDLRLCTFIGLPQASTPQCSILGEMHCHGTVNNYSMHN